jgi:hypothetical protein
MMAVSIDERQFFAINDPLHAKFHESPPSAWPRRRDLGGDASIVGRAW